MESKHQSKVFLKFWRLQNDPDFVNNREGHFSTAVLLRKDIYREAWEDDVFHGSLAQSSPSYSGERSIDSCFAGTIRAVTRTF